MVLIVIKKPLGVQQIMLGLYDTGATTFYACQFDQRFSYCLYVPKINKSKGKMWLFVLIHGSRRTAEGYRDACAEFAEKNNAMVLVPLFPVGIPTPEDTGGYKFVLDSGIRYDHILLAMVKEVGERYPVETDRFYMHGFSGGGQFANRFLYLWPQRLVALSVGAPGLVTLHSNQDWWVGTKNIQSLFGIKLDFDTISQVPVQVIVGDQDLDSSEIMLTPVSRYWMEGANQAGENRIQRAQNLALNWQQQGIKVQFEVVPGIGHGGFDLLPQVFSFFEEKLYEPRAE